MILGLAVVHAFCCGVGVCLESWSVRGAKHRYDRQWTGQCVKASAVANDTEPCMSIQRLRGRAEAAMRWCMRLGVLRCPKRKTGDVTGGREKTKKIWGGRTSLVSHLVVGLELLSGAFDFVSPSLLLYNGRVVAIAVPLDSETLDCAVKGLAAAVLDAVVVAPFSSITVPGLLCAPVTS